jgi:hypothetical protein
VIKNYVGAGDQWLMPVVLATWGPEIRRSEVRGQLGQIVHNTLSQKYPTHKRTGKVAQVVECLSSKYKFPSSNFGTTSPPKKEVFYFYIVVYLVYYNVCQRTFGFNFYF